MTDLTKPVKRKTPVTTGSKARHFVVTLYPEGVNREASIGLREAGKRTEYRATLAGVYWHAVKQAADRQRAEKAKAKAARKELQK